MEVDRLLTIYARDYSVNFVSLNESKVNADYYAGLGTIVYDKNVNEYVIEHDGVVVYPWYKCMTYI